MNPNELEFLAENDLIQIIPRFKMEAIDLIEHFVGPFQPNIPCEVPLWLAIHLRRQQKCRIIPPTWLCVTSLTEFKEAEELESGCTKPPHPHYTEVATLLLQHAPDDLPEFVLPLQFLFLNLLLLYTLVFVFFSSSQEAVRTLIKDLWDARVGKFVSSVNQFISSGAATARVSQLTCLELATVRNILANSLDQLAILRQKVAERSSEIPSQSQSLLGSTGLTE
uniref:DNA replication complex GINS protein PSF2 n=1 Tax=Schistocephalus solidus TaxID=70667 RepID=A0A0X3P914_SCHSO